MRSAPVGGQGERTPLSVADVLGASAGDRDSLRLAERFANFIIFHNLEFCGGFGRAPTLAGRPSPSRISRRPHNSGTTQAVDYIMTGGTGFGPPPFARSAAGGGQAPPGV
jgi:hypothetical protein